MSSIITHQLRKAIADAIYDDISSRRNNYYYFFGRYLDSETVPAAPETSIEYEQTVRNHIAAAKKIYASDVAYVVPRFDWAANVIYPKYNTLMSGDITSEGPQFYVYDDVNYRVYKCIDNNGEALSTIRPFSTDAFDVTYSDGYIWRYMYSLPTSIRNKFLTSTHLPVSTALTNRYYSDGGISDINIIKSGANYTQTTSIITVSGDGTGAELEPVIIDGRLGNIIVKNPGRNYTKAIISITDSGNGSGAEAVVNLSAGDLDSDQALIELLTVAGTVDSVDVLSPGSGYTSATVEVKGDGTGAVAEAVISGETISKINITDKGEGYSYAYLVITPQFTFSGSAATTRVNVSPFRGHGKNAIEELFADQLMLYANISSDRLSDFDVVSPYNQFGIIKNLRNLDYSSNIYDQVSPNRYQVEANFGPSVTFVGGGGVGAKGRVNVTGNYVSDVSIETAGAGYSSAPLISFGQAYPTLTVTRNTTTATSTATFDPKVVAPYPVGSKIIVAGVTPSSYNGTFTVTACTTSSVSWEDTNVAEPVTAQGTVITSGSGATAVSTISANLKASTALLGYSGVGYSSAPGVVLSSTSGSGGAITATTSLGVGAIKITNQGSGYTAAPTVNFNGGTGSGANASAVVSGGKVVKIIINSPGQYTVLPTVTVSGGTGGTGAAVQSAVISTFTASALTIKKSGSRYATPPNLVFNGACGVSDIVVENPGTLFTAGSNPALTFSGGGGAGLKATAYVNTCVNDLVITNSGSGYNDLSPPNVIFSGTGGSAPFTLPTGTAVVSGGKVVAVNITNRGANYTSYTVSFSATGWTATTAVTLNQELFVSDATSNRRYIVSVAGTTSSTAPTHTIGAVANGTATLVYAGILATATVSVGVGISHVNVEDPGTGYTSTPTISVANNGTRTGYKLTPVLGKATGSVSLSGFVNSVTITSNGSGYTSAPAVVLTGGSPSIDAALYSEVVGDVSSISILEGGSGYTSSPKVIITGGSGSKASYAATISTVTNKVTSCTKISGGSNYITTNFADFTVGSILVDEQLNEYNVYSAKTNLKNNSLIITSNNGTAVYANMKLRKKYTSNYFITNNTQSQKLLESRFPVACYIVRAKFSLLNFIAGTSLTYTDSVNGEKKFIIISTQVYDTTFNEMLLLPIDGGILNTGTTLSNGVNSFSVNSFIEPALDRRTGEVLMISNNSSAFTQNNDQTLSFRTIINF